MLAKRARQHYVKFIFTAELIDLGGNEGMGSITALPLLRNFFSFSFLNDACVFY